ncbi:MAG TPA: hypothetical protein VFL47_00980, partial [Flavisolibacter sp.]|nr:hypothetical protein [Flavisolibacter sp.]
LSAADELRELSPLLAGLPKTLPYSVPEGYFDANLASLPFVYGNEASALLGAIGKTMPYAVPQGYFENLPQQVLAHVATPKAKVVPLFARTWMRAAVAAAIGGVMFIGGYRLLNSNENEEARAGLSRPDTTRNMVAKTSPSVVQEIKTASTAELDAFIKSVPVNTEKTAKNDIVSPKKNGKVSKMLQNVSVKEIDAFLDQLPSGEEDLALID